MSFKQVPYMSGIFVYACKRQIDTFFPYFATDKGGESEWNVLDEGVRNNTNEHRPNFFVHYTYFI